MKTHKTTSELIDHLKVDRHLNLEKEYIGIFDEYRYGVIIDAYKDIIATNILTGNIHIYDPSTSLKTFVNLLNIDEYFSIKLITYISHYEKLLKKYISDVICNSMVNAGSLDCCDYTLFEKTKNDSLNSYLDCFVPLDQEYDYDAKPTIRKETTYKNRIRVIDKILAFVSGANSSELNYYASDYLKEKHSVPFYILIGSLSFSNLIVLFEMFEKNIQFDFLKTIINKKDIENRDLRIQMGKHNVMRIIRNIIHHHEPLIPFLCRKEFIDFETKKSAIKILMNVYNKALFIEKVNLSSEVDFDIISILTSKKAHKLNKIIEILQ